MEELQSLGGVDLCLATILLLCTLKGAFSGLMGQLLALLSAIVGFFGARWATALLAPWISSFIPQPFAGLISWMIAFVIIVNIVSIVGKSVLKTLRFGSLGFIDHLLGAVVGLILAALVLICIIGLYRAGYENGWYPDLLANKNLVIYPYLEQLSRTFLPSHLFSLNI